MNRRLLAVAPVDDPGGAEIHLLRLLAGLGSRGWDITLATPGRGGLRDMALGAGYSRRALPLGGLGRGAGARAVRSWPRIRALAAAAERFFVDDYVERVERLIAA
jgi:hypothetical protein